MSDNPFAENDDTEHTVVGRAAPSAPPPPADDEATRVAPAPRSAPRSAPRAVPRSVPDPPPAEPSAEVASAVLAAPGTEPLVAAAAPLLQLLGRLRNTLTAPDPGDLRERTGREIREFEKRARAAGTPPHVLRLAHYALCASLDDVVLSTPWGSSGVWDSRSLVSTFHHEVQSGERFFDVVDLARQNPARFAPLLELMYLCLSLGFMGRYRLSPRGPAEIDQLREELYSQITAQRPRVEPELSPAWRGVAAPYRPARARLPLWVAASFGLAVLGAGYIGVSWSLNGTSDAVYEHALAAPPAAMPVLARAAPVQPPAMPAVAPGALERLRAFLKPEIDAGLVEVLGTENTPIVRLHQAGSFGPGSATIEPRAVRVVERIGAALRDEKGSVQVLGYTDDVPIHTVRFPSNFQLSAARAAAAKDILAHAVPVARLSAEGRADADPIASNAAPAGRDANRRIEIVLHRQG